MLIKIFSNNLEEAISLLQEEVEDKTLEKTIENTEDGEVIYLPWGEIEI